METEYLTLTELHAHIFGGKVPKRTISTWVHRNQIPHYRAGPRTTLFRRDEIEEWLKRGRHPAQQDRSQPTAQNVLHTDHHSPSASES